MRRFVLTASALTVLAACQPATTELTEEMKAEIAAEVEQRVAEYADAIQLRDIDDMLEFWADVDGFVMAADGELNIGHDVFAN
jgi:hypothetical protein